MITLPAAAAALDGLARRCPRQHPLRSFLRLRVRGGPRPTQTYSRPTGAGREGPATAPCAGLTERAGAPRPPAGRNGSRRSHLQTLADSETSTNPSLYYYYHHHYHYFIFLSESFRPRDPPRGLQARPSHWQLRSSGIPCCGAGGPRRSSTAASAHPGAGARNGDAARASGAVSMGNLGNSQQRGRRNLECAFKPSDLAGRGPPRELAHSAGPAQGLRVKSRLSDTACYLTGCVARYILVSGA